MALDIVNYKYKRKGFATGYEPFPNDRKTLLNLFEANGLSARNNWLNDSL
jgi:hypothetical protein